MTGDIIKIVDEHNIERQAKIITSIEVDDSSYVIYAIDRDGENVNIFVSKLLNLEDGTCKFINIEDTSEKNRLDDIVKDLIKRSLS